MDLHFIVWALIFAFALFGFFRSIARLDAGDKEAKLLPDEEGINYSN
jgi:hypothetical protein